MRTRQQVQAGACAWLAVAAAITAGWLSTTNLLFQFLIKVGWLPLYLLSTLLRAMFGSGDLVVFLSAAPILLIAAALVGAGARWQAYTASRTGFAATRNSGNVAWFLLCVAPLWSILVVWLIGRAAAASR